MNRARLILAAAALFTSSAAFAEGEIQLRAKQLPGWDARAREGRCEIRVWVDNRAEVCVRGDAIFVRTLEGSKARDEGSECSQPLPYNSVGGFQIRQTAGRDRVVLAQEPSRMNNYTAMISIDDPQGGGDNYAFEVSWRAEADIATAPAPFFDDVRARVSMPCGSASRARTGVAPTSTSSVSQTGMGQDQDRGQGRDAGRNQARNRGQESIQGHGNARTSNESRDMTYSCGVDTRQNQVMSAAYQYSGNGLRGNDRANDRRQLR